MSARVLEFVTDAAEDGAKLDRLVSHHANVSRRIARMLITRGLTQVNGHVVKILTKPLRAGSRVRVELDAAAASNAPTPRAPRDREAPPGPQLGPGHVIHLDAAMVVIDKPPALLSEADRFGNVSLQSLVPKLLASLGERHTNVWLVHRLDAGTSGVIVLARSSSAARALVEGFREAAMRKVYVALASGRIAETRDVEQPVGRAQGVRHKVDPTGKPAFTRFEPLAATSQATFVRCLPRTGRTHQIRVHLSHLGHPILGDRLYGGPGYTAGTPPRAIGRPMLHALELEVPHPKTRARIVFRAPLPADFVALARELGLDAQVPAR